MNYMESIYTFLSLAEENAMRTNFTVAVFSAVSVISWMDILSTSLVIRVFQSSSQQHTQKKTHLDTHTHANHQLWLQHSHSLMLWISNDMVAETWARGTSLTAGQPFSWPQGWSSDWKKHYSMLTCALAQAVLQSSLYPIKKKNKMACRN